MRTVVSKHEFGALGEDFEKKEHQLFGEEGFEKISRNSRRSRTLSLG
jgi:hypothetical protein